MSGDLTSLGTATSANLSFEWGVSAGSLPNTRAVGSANVTGVFSANITALSPGVTYYYRAKAVGHDTGYGEVKSFTTLSTPPSVATDNASNVSYLAARLNGTLGSRGTASPVGVSFQWGMATGNYTSETPVQSVNTTGAYFADLATLSGNTTYYFRAKAVGHGTVYGLEKSFTTLPTSPPTIVTLGAAGVTSDYAGLSANLTSLGTASPVAVYVECGTSPTSFTLASTPSSFTSPGVYSNGGVIGLAPGTTYYYRAVANGGGHGIARGEIKTFTTQAAPAGGFGGGGFGGGGGGGGGFGGGGGGAPAGPGVTNLGAYTNGAGLFNLAATVKSEDGKAILMINKGVQANTNGGLGLSSIKIVPFDNPPAPPADSYFYALAYEFTPEGATFVPGISLTILFDPAKLPADVDIGSVGVAVWNAKDARWDTVKGTLNQADSSVTIPLDHFSIYTLVGKKLPPPQSPPPPAPASFTVSNLTVSPDTVQPGQAVTVSVMVTNTGGTAGGYDVTLKVQGGVAETKKVSLASGASQTVSFGLASGSTPGPVEIDVNGLKGSFTVQETQHMLTPVPQSETPTTPTPRGMSPAAVIGIIIGGLIAIAGLALGIIIVRWRR